MNVSIKTAGKCGVKLYKAVAESLTVVSFSDNDPHKWNTFIDDVMVESAFEMKKRVDQGTIQGVLISGEMEVTATREMYRELREIGIDSDKIFFVPIEFLKGDDSELKLLSYDEYNYLYYLEFHLTNKCNLNCAGCSHFVPLIPKEDEIDYKELEKDLLQLKKIVSHIQEIRIMGGEPLLSKNLCNCLDLTRQLYPYTDIRIATNGILIKQMSSDVQEALERNNISLDITCYPPVYNIYNEVATFLKEKKIGFNMDIRWGMCPVLHKDNEHKFINDSTALTCICYNLYKGRMYPCSIAAFIKYYNSYFNENYPESSGIDIYTVKNFKELYSELTAVMSICNYCNQHTMFNNYSRPEFRQCDKEKMNKNDWIESFTSDSN